VPSFLKKLREFPKHRLRKQPVNGHRACTIDALEPRQLLTAAAVAVDLSAAYRRIGIVADKTTIAAKGGIDGSGHAFSSKLLGTSVTWNGNTFTLGPAGANDVVSSAGQNIVLPATAATTLNVLALCVNGSLTGQTFTVTYTDNTTQVFTQSISDWSKPQKYTGESTAVSMSYRDNSAGTQTNGTYLIYGYSFTLNSSKTLKSIKLPTNSNVEVMAMDVTPANGAPPPVTPPPVNPPPVNPPPVTPPTSGTAVQVDLSAAYSRIGIIPDNTTFAAKAGIDLSGHAFSSKLLGTSKTWNGNTFTFGPVGAYDIVASAGQNITLPATSGTMLSVLALCVNGGQTNQTFTVTYTDNTTQVFTQSISDWAKPQKYAGESTAISMSYRDNSGGTQTAGTYLIYGYSFALNSNKTLKSVKLPTNSNVQVVAMDVTPLASAPPITPPVTPPPVTPPSTGPTPPPISGTWNLSFNDNFDTLNPSTWTDEYWWGGNAGTQATFDPNNVSVSNGTLSLTATHQSETSNTGVANPYTSGLISTGGIAGIQPLGFSFTYGYIEVRTRIAPGQGMWSALWMLPVSHQDNYEMDVFENLGRAPTTFQGFVHNAPNYGSGVASLDFNMTQDYHVYGMDWEPDHVTWYVDGNAVATVTNTSLISTQAMYLMLNLDVGGAWAGFPDSTTPQSSSWLVDYLRVWQKTPSFTSATTTTVSSSLDPSSAGQPVTFNATVAADGTTPTGTVQFVVDGANFGAPVPLVNGSASTGSITSLSSGSHTVSAIYSGDANDTASTSASLAQTIAPVAPANDNFANATVISGTSATVTGSNIAATKEAGEPNHAGDPGGSSVWWAWTAPADGTVSIDTHGSNFDTVLGVYTGSSVSTLTAVPGGSNDDDPAGGTTTSAVSFAVTAGTTYWIAVDGHGGATGAITLNLGLS
jgi:beta-glucanase (GH16 family)